MEIAYHWKADSKNGKTGAMPVTMTGNQSCPPSCPLNPLNPVNVAAGTAQCYAGKGPMSWGWNDLSYGARPDKKSAVRGIGLKALVAHVAALPENALWRHNQAGDLPGIGDDIDAAALSEIVAANAGRRGFTYSHKPVLDRPDNAAAIRAANDGGFTVNLSANNLAEADQLAALGIGPVAVLLPHDTPVEMRATRTPDGRVVTVCPKHANKAFTCVACKGLCQRRNRDSIVGFPGHGGSNAMKEGVSKLARGAA